MRDQREGSARFRARIGRIVVAVSAILMVAIAVSIWYIGRIEQGAITPNRDYLPRGKRVADLIWATELRRYTEVWKQASSGGAFHVEVHPSCIVHVYKREHRYLFCIPDVSNPKFAPCDERYLIDPVLKRSWSGCDVSVIGLNEVHGDLYFKPGGPSSMFPVTHGNTVANSECIDPNELMLRVRGDLMTFDTASGHRITATGWE